MIQLQCIGHTIEYELTHIVNLFIPYVAEPYVVKAVYEHPYAIACLYKDDKLIGQVKKSPAFIGKEVPDKRGLKQALKKAVYDVLFALTGKEMPWGILTGIRPTKIAHEYIKESLSEDNIRRVFEEEYYLSPHKTKLMLQVAKHEVAVLEQNKQDEISLYIGIPFCPTRCVYCSFTAFSLEKKGDLVEDYLDALCKEIDYVAEAKKGVSIRSLYIGGGTPTSLNEVQLKRLLGHIQKRFDLEAIGEYTVEAGRPDTITTEKLSILKALGVNRISINPQTMNQKTLDTIGRKHTVDDIKRVFYEARDLGHEQINMDMIVGLPGESIEDVAYTLKELAKLSPENITVHTMTIKRASRLKEEQQEYDLIGSEEIEKMLDLCEVSIGKMGLEPYYMYRQKNMLGNFENVGYAKPGTEGIYNIEIMEEKQTIVALGAGAVTKIVYEDGEKLERVPNVKNLEDYINRIDEMIKRKEEGFLKYH